MKVSHLLVPALLLAGSSAAMAQSSVTLYGLVDLGVGKIAGSKTEMQGSGSPLINTDSHIGLKGVEDLGGGLKAGFAYETAINAENGASSGWEREAHVWLGGNWGTFTMGHTRTPSFWGLAAYELTGAANYSVVANTYGVVGAGERESSQFLYSTPEMGGFKANLGYITKTDRAGSSKADLSLTYGNGPLAAGLSYNKEQGSKANYAVGAKYSFSSVTVAASYQDTRTLGTGLRRSGMSLGGQVSFGAASLALDVTRDSNHELGNVKLKKYTNALIEAKYSLSKRTSVYGVVLRLSGDNHYGVGMMHAF